MSVDVHDTGGVFVVRPNITHVTGSAGGNDVRDALRVAVSDGRLAVAVDLGGVKFADHSTIEAIVDTQKTLMRTGGDLCVFDIEMELREFFQQTFLDRFIQICTDEEDAAFHFEKLPKRKRWGPLRFLSR